MCIIFLCVRESQKGKMIAIKFKMIPNQLKKADRLNRLIERVKRIARERVNERFGEVK